MRFSYRMVPEVYQVFWAGMAAGEFISDAAVAAGSYRKQGSRWLAAVGGVRPRRGRNLKGRLVELRLVRVIASQSRRSDTDPLSTVRWRPITAWLMPHLIKGRAPPGHAAVSSLRSGPRRAQR